MKNTEKLFKIESNAQFSDLALEIFKYQSTHCAPYKEYIELIGINKECVKTVEEIPFLPIELFKSHKVYCGTEPHDLIFCSSGTTGSTRSTHFIKDHSIYIDSFTNCFREFYNAPSSCNIYALLPSYLENEHSSLIYMIDHLINDSYDGGFFLYNHKELADRINNRDKSKKTILFGVSFALLDLVEQFTLDLSENVIVMETGGMKGRREELSREQLHKILCERLGIEQIHSEYGMCECLSQSYSNGNGIFHSPNWVKIMIRDVHNPFKIMGLQQRGGINIIDLANVNSCSFLQTQDIGIKTGENSFTVEGRVDNSDIRGCNLLLL